MSVADSTSRIRMSIDEHDNDRDTASVGVSKKDKSDSSSIVEADSSSDSSSETRINCCADWDKPLGIHHDKYSRKERLLYGGFCTAIGLATIGATIALVSSENEHFTPVYATLMGLVEGAMVTTALSFALKRCCEDEYGQVSV